MYGAKQTTARIDDAIPKNNFISISKVYQSSLFSLCVSLFRIRIQHQIKALGRSIFLSKLFSSKKFLRTGSWFVLLNKHHSAFRFLHEKQAVVFLSVIFTSFKCPRQESNLHHKYRKLESYPLNDEGI